MGKLNKTCLVCGKEYHYCYTCPTDLQNPSWKNLFDTEQCKEIFNILSRHGQGMITDDEAKELLNECDLTQKDTFAESIKNHINQVYGNIVAVEDVQVEIKVDEKNVEVEEVMTSGFIAIEEEKTDTELAQIASITVTETTLPKPKHKKRHKK